MSYDELTYKHLNNLKDKIRDVLRFKNLDNTGDAENSLEISGNELLGNDYIYYLDKGRGSGKFPPVNNIVEWVRSKLGLTGTESKQVAFLVGRKIANEGTEIFKDNSKGIELDKLVDETLKELLKELPDKAAAEALTWL